MAARPPFAGWPLAGCSPYTVQPFVAGALQQNYQSSLPMFISIGGAALAAGGIILLANRARVAAGSERLAEPRAA